MALLLRSSGLRSARLPVFSWVSVPGLVVLKAASKAARGAKGLASPPALRPLWGTLCCAGDRECLDVLTPPPFWVQFSLCLGFSWSNSAWRFLFIGLSWRCSLEWWLSAFLCVLRSLFVPIAPQGYLWGVGFV